MRHVKIEKRFAPDLPQIPADGDQLRQVAINLILNAGAAMSRGGTLVVATVRDDEGFVNISFADSGAGIPKENLEKILEPFFTTKAKGTGLGLAITKQIVEMHHGKLEIDSEVGRGTTVTVRLPVEREEF